VLKTGSTIFVSSLMIVLFISACSSPKRGFVFRGDWAFEYNRTPWIGHPGNTDIPGTESSGKETKKKICPVCKQEKGETSWKDALLGPFANKDKKCLCDRIRSGGGIPGGNPYGGNINITSYNPTVANTFPGAFGGGYPGTLPPGSLSLPPGAVVVPNGVLLPNGTLLPQSLFFPQAGGMTAGVPNAGQNNPAQNGAGNTVPPQPPLSPNATNANGVAPQGEQGIPGQVPGTFNPQNGTPSTVPPAPASQLPPGQLTPGQLAPGQVTPGSEQAALLQMQSILPGLSGAGINGVGVNSPSIPQTAPMPGYASSLAPQWQNSQNPMLVNPAANQVVPGLSMTGTQAPGYPPIGYAPTGYSPGYAQQMVAPMPGVNQVNPLTATATAKTGQNDSDEESGDEAAEASRTAARRSMAQMPYPRFHPVPTHPAFQRSMGMAPGYAALQPPRNMGMPYMQPPLMQSPVMNPMMQQQLMQQQMMQQQLLQQQMMMRQQQTAYAQQMQQLQQRSASPMPASSNRVALRTTTGSGNTVPNTSANRLVSMSPEDEENAVVSASDNQAPMPPKSKVILANQQSDILQDTPPPVSRTTQVNLTQTKKSKSP